MPKAEEVTQPNQKSLFAQLNEHFSLDELRELCFELGIDPEGLDLRRKGSFLVDLLRTCEQRGLLPNLVQAVVAKRPFLSDLTALQSVDLGLPEPPFWQRPAFFIPVGILIILTIVTTLVVNFGGDNFIASRILPPTPTATATPLPTMTPTPTATPLPIAVAQPGEQLIVIATFARAEGVADAQAQAEIQRGIQAAAAELDFASLRVEVVPDVLPSDDRPGAAALAELYGASMVIWGSETAVRITTNFLNVSEAPYESGDVQVSVVRPDAYVQFITEDLPSQFVFLSLFAIGQSYYAKGAYDEAIAAIETAVANVTNPDTVANEVGQAYFRLGWLYHEPKADLVSAAAAYAQAIAL
ncbi:MAG: hypothetical protein KC434_18960, partial [Anaerolineales bacterium]|nr:hypothetical protein [Anaerolineales bacterium]